MTRVPKRQLQVINQTSSRQWPCRLWVPIPRVQPGAYSSLVCHPPERQRDDSYMAMAVGPITRQPTNKPFDFEIKHPHHHIRTPSHKTPPPLPSRSCGGALHEILAAPESSCRWDGRSGAPETAALGSWASHPACLCPYLCFCVHVCVCGFMSLDPGVGIGISLPKQNLGEPGGIYTETWPLRRPWVCGGIDKRFRRWGLGASSTKRRTPPGRR